ncbi:MAG: flagellar basal body rod protein FlgC [Acetobacteraceae bacterium]|nr:flagellar basal body rod protein FlgC [Acetobacteraceae bacterium]
MNLDRSIAVSASGMAAQSARLRVVAENLANRDTTGDAPGAEPYRRKTVTFRSQLDRASGTTTVQAARIGTQPGNFPEMYEPGHPAADERGYVRRPNVDSLVEVMDMREAQRSYSANLSVLETTRAMLMRTIEVLRG